MLEGIIKMLVKLGFDFHCKEFFILIHILKNNSNTLINKNEIDFSLSSPILTFQTQPKNNN